MDVMREIHRHVYYLDFLITPNMRGNDAYIINNSISYCCFQYRFAGTDARSYFKLRGTDAFWQQIAYNSVRPVKGAAHQQHLKAV